MNLHYWLYVSRCLVPRSETDQTIRDIVKTSQARNVQLEIPGALIFGDGHFGQIVEGPASSIMALRSSILRDIRHVNVLTVADGTIERRQFGEWSLAYAGDSIVVSRFLRRALRDGAKAEPEVAENLIYLMHEAVAPLSGG